MSFASLSNLSDTHHASAIVRGACPLDNIAFTKGVVRSAVWSKGLAVPLLLRLETVTLGTYTCQHGSSTVAQTWNNEMQDLPVSAQIEARAEKVRKNGEQRNLQDIRATLAR